MVAWSHNIAMLEDGVLEHALAAFVRQFTLRELTPAATRREIAAAVQVAAQIVADSAVTLYDASRRAAAAILREAVGDVVYEEVVPYTKGRAKELVQRLMKRNSWASRVAFITRKAEARAAELLADSLEKGLLPGQIESRLEQAFGARHDWQTFVRVEIQRVHNTALKDTYDANDDVVRGMQAVATLDGRTCPVCGGLDGRVFTSDPPQFPLHPRCRCILSPVLRAGVDIERRTGTKLPPKMRDTLDGRPADRVSYAQWLGSQDKETQRAALGAKRFELFEKGAPISSFSTGERSLSSDELATLEPAKVADHGEKRVPEDERLAAWWRGEADAPGVYWDVSPQRPRTTRVTTRHLVAVIIRRGQESIAERRMGHVTRRTITRALAVGQGARVKLIQLEAWYDTPQQAHDIAKGLADDLGPAADIRLHGEKLQDWKTAVYDIKRGGGMYFEQVSARGRGTKISIPPTTTHDLEIAALQVDPECPCHRRAPKVIGHLGRSIRLGCASGGRWTTWVTV